MKRKRIVLTGVMFLMMTVVELSGCRSVSERKQQAAEALQQKYQEKFEIIAFKDTALLEDYYTVKAYSVEYPDLQFKAYVNEETGNITDSYVTKRLCDRVSEKMNINLASLENDYYVFVDTTMEDTIFSDVDISLENYLKEMPKNKFSVYLCIDKTEINWENVASSLLNMMDGINGINGTLYIYLTDSALLAQIQEYVTSHDDIYSEFDKMTADAYIGFTKIENGNFFLTEDSLRKMAGGLL